MDKNIKKIVYFFELLVLIYIIGMLGYMYFEKYNLVDSFYMTAITISTVGFSEVRELSETGKIFTTILIFSGVTIVLYGLSSITAFLIEGELQNYLRGVKMKKDIKNLENHNIICGAGKTGMKVIEELIKLKNDFVVIEQDENKIEEIKEEFGQDVLIIKGDSTKDEILSEAGIDKACVLISVLPSDAENVFLTLTARYLNKEIKIITRSIDQTSEIKLRKAGADFIISPLDIAAQRIVRTAINPEIVNFLDVITSLGGEDLRLEAVTIEKESDLDSIFLKDARIPQKTNLIVIGIKSESGTIINPNSMTLMEKGNELYVLGNDKQINILRRIASGEEKDINLIEKKVKI